MTPQEFVSLQNRLKSLEEKVSEYESVVNNIKLLQQKSLQSNRQIPPGIACKVAYDQKGLILRSEQLKESDIPELSIDKISGLQKTLDRLSSRSNNTTKSTDTSSNIPRLHIQSGTGTKINVDEYGRVTSYSDLNSSDIPKLPIEHIEGLNDKLNFLEELHSNSINSEEDNSSKINPGTYCKITYDSDGRVLGGTRMSMDDIPSEIVSRVTSIESRLSMIPNKESIDTLLKDVENKIDNVSNISPGMYTKVNVNKQGVILSGENITIDDLPDINISNIINLESTLRNKVDRLSFIELSNTVSSLVNNGHISEISRIKKSIEDKANHRDVVELKSQMNTLREYMDNITNKLPSEYIVEEVDSLKGTIDSVIGRLITLEKKLNIYEDFSE